MNKLNRARFMIRIISIIITKFSHLSRQNTLQTGNDAIPLRNASNDRITLVRPFCRSPISRVGIPNDGASIIPLDELPITAAACANAE